MKIQSALPLPAPVRKSSAPPAPEEPGNSDQAEISGAPRRTAGAVGAMAGALTGRVVASAAVGAAGAVLGNALGGTVGAVVGAAAGLYGGVKLELKSKLGRLAGGMLGGAMGSVLGAAAGVAGWKPSATMAQETKGFSLTALPGRLLDPHYTSHPKMSQEIAAQGMAHIQPGDVLITNDDGNFQLEILQRMLGCTADWTHNYLVDKDLTVMDILLDKNEPTRWSLEYAFTDNSHLKVLRPAYASEESRDKTLEVARSKFGTMKYDFKFDLQSDDAQYCQEYTYKAIKEGSPEIRLEPRHRIFREFMSSDEFEASPDMKEVWSTGSNFWLNWLSHFT